MNEIMGITRLRMATDGKGIATLVTFYGCPLRCKYCINSFCNDPETIRAEYTPQELVDKLAIDDSYFKMTGGGVVFGGGEPLMNTNFICDVCSIIDKQWAIRVETSLNVPWKNIEPLIPYIDQWIIDIKDINPEIYKKYTGCDNVLVLENLDRMVHCVENDKILVRVPLIYQFNTKEDVARTKEYLEEKYEVEVDVFEYQVL